jgi:hypothetical protein
MSVTAPVYDAIVRVVQLYVGGVNDHDAEKFTEAFHEDAWMYYTDAEGALHKHCLATVAEGLATWRVDVTGRIISVIQAGDVACVLLGYDDSRGPSHSWVDIHSLLRIDGVWKIMNETATHSSRAGRA